MLTLGWALADWLETFSVHGPGDIQGRRYTVDDEFLEILLHAYKLRSDGRRVIRRGFVSRPKGWAKSEKAGEICVLEGLAPVRFDHWADEGEKSSWGYHYKIGEPVGRPIVAPEILVAATEESQAGNTYDVAAFVCAHLRDGYPDRFSALDPGLTRTFLGNGGVIQPITAKARSKDGGKSTFVVFDETHLYETPDLRNLHATIRRNLGAKRKESEPWSLETSTMYQPGMDSVAEQTHEYARAIADGRLNDDSLLFDHREARHDFDFEDDEELHEALVDVYGAAAVYQDLDRIIAEIRDPQTDEAAARRFYLNQVVRATEQAFDPIRWGEMADVEHVVPDRALITLGFDGARFHDATGLVATEVATGYQFVLGVWEKPFDASDDWKVDEAEVHQVVDMAFDRYDVWRMYADPPYWETEVGEWAARHGEKKVMEWYTHRNRYMAYAVRAFVTAQMSGALSHDGDSVYRRHIANARRKNLRMRDESGRFLWVITKEHAGSPNKIDLAMAGILSWEARNDALAKGALTTQPTGAGGIRRGGQIVRRSGDG